MSEVYYRKAMVRDAETLADMWAKTLEENEVPFRTTDGEEFEKLYVAVMYAIRSSQHFTWVLEIDGEVKGFVSGYVHAIQWGYPDLIGHYDCVYVDKKYRGKGYGDKLINLFRVFAGDSQATLLTMETVFSSRLAKIWERKGWKPCQITYGMEVEQ